LVITSPVSNELIKKEDFHPTAPRITYSHSSLESWLVDYTLYFGTIGLADYLYEHGFTTNHALASLDCPAVLTCVPGINLGAAAELVTLIQNTVIQGRGGGEKEEKDEKDEKDEKAAPPPAVDIDDFIGHNHG